VTSQLQLLIQQEVLISRLQQQQTHTHQKHCTNADVRTTMSRKVTIGGKKGVLNVPQVTPPNVAKTWNVMITLASVWQIKTFKGLMGMTTPKDAI